MFEVGKICKIKNQLGSNVPANGYDTVSLMLGEKVSQFH